MPRRRGTTAPAVRPPVLELKSVQYSVGLPLTERSRASPPISTGVAQSDWR
jgi:hypothetical protein